MHEGHKKKDEWWTAENTLTLACSAHNARALLSRSRPLGPRDVLLINQQSEEQESVENRWHHQSREGVVKVV